VHADNMYKLLVDLNDMEEVESCYPFGQEHHVVFRGENEKRNVEAKLKQLGYNQLSFEKIEAGIEDSFMALMRT
jgi:ABC-2 type transport system ATP-binding protein